MWGSYIWGMKKASWMGVRVEPQLAAELKRLSDKLEIPIAQLHRAALKALVQHAKKHKDKFPTPLDFDD